ncbi:hypothetical protein SL1157_3121 [Ruegeria lacuscaerulensis ITI-1157]|nr:hypothetical protein SL1157_3121 [Ruegeria lacuscaerulensis ITI-1157]
MVPEGCPRMTPDISDNMAGLPASHGRPRQFGCAPNGDS